MPIFATNRSTQQANAGMQMLPRMIIACVLCFSVIGCDGNSGEGGSARPRTDATLREQLLVVMSSPPQIVVSAQGELAQAQRFGRTLAPDALLKRNGARRVRADSLPWLTQSKTGRRFLAAPAPRALARGAPAEKCPASAAAAGPSPDPSRAEGRAFVADAALTACLAALPSRARRSGCGCKLIALNDVLTEKRDEMAYATGVTARILAPDFGLDGVAIAEEEPGGGILLRSVTGPFAELTLEGDGAEGTAQMAFLPGETGKGAVLTGTREALGYRRGRLAERIYLSDADGRRAIILIGFAPEELVNSAAAWLVWPTDG